MRMLFLILLISSLAGSEESPGPEGEPVPMLPDRSETSERTGDGAGMDLDFAEDFPAPGRGRIGRTAGNPAPAAAPSGLAPSSRSHAWIYWTLGLSAMAGGLTWYLHLNLSEPPHPVRTEEVFTDGPG